MESLNYDAVIIGGGVTGCAVARELSRYERLCTGKGRGCVLGNIESQQRHRSRRA